ncbi:MAG: PTS sugar transporter subunit IIB [Elusimicrobia bacterium]|nr:PTS sugar transporter subunit IIB [Elusimicrobiota bacterium]
MKNFPDILHSTFYILDFMVVLYRIDNRLIHAQILESWLPFTQAGLLAVVSDEACGDEVRQRLALYTAPEAVKVVFWSIKQAASSVESLDRDEAVRAILIFATPQDVLAYIRAGGAKPAEVNVGGMHYAICRISLGPYRTFTQDDRQALLELHDIGVRLDARPTPNDAPCDLLAMLKA